MHTRTPFHFDVPCGPSRDRPPRCPPRGTGGQPNPLRAFTIIELLVVVSIIALLIAILLPAISKARDSARLTQSLANLRNIAVAHQSYAAEWNDRQYTAVHDAISQYGSDLDAFDAFAEANGRTGPARDHPANHPPTYLGWGHEAAPSTVYRMFAYRCDGNCANAALTLPIEFTGAGCNPDLAYFGAFRLPNALNFSNYVSGRFYDPVFYAPKDRVVIDAIGDCQDSPDQFCVHTETPDVLGQIPVWSSYCTSPAAMFSPEVMRRNDPADDSANGFRDPWSFGAGFRSPSFSQALYPNLKTHVLEHHWLQGAIEDCNPSFSPGTYGVEGCEPYYFNHAWESSPATLFYDGHIETVGVRRAMRADGRMRAQTGVDGWELWSRDTPFRAEGYFIRQAYDLADTSFHILTTDGIRGRDISGN